MREKVAHEDHKQIYLQPICGEAEIEGRQWCQDNVWGDKCEDCDAVPVKFIRADIVEQTFGKVFDLLITARNSKDEEALQEAIDIVATASCKSLDF